MIQLSAFAFTLVLLRRKKITLWSVCVTTRKWCGFFLLLVLCMCLCDVCVLSLCPYGPFMPMINFFLPYSVLDSSSYL